MKNDRFKTYAELTDYGIGMVRSQNQLLEDQQIHAQTDKSGDSGDISTKMKVKHAVLLQVKPLSYDSLYIICGLRIIGQPTISTIPGT